MRYGILGPLDVCDDEGRSVRIAGTRQRALLAVLLLNANRVVSVDALVDALWGAALRHELAMASHSVAMA